MTGPLLRPDSRPSLRFQRDCRLLNAVAYRQVFECKPEPRKTTDRYWTILAAPNGGGGARLGLIMMKKRVKLAVKRNRLKRLTRESFRQHRHSLTGLDIIVMARQDAATADSQLLGKALLKHWQRLAKYSTPAASATLLPHG